MTWKEIAIRAVKTALQTGLAVVVASQTGLYSVDTWKAAGTAGLAALLSAITNALHTSEDKATP